MREQKERGGEENSMKNHSWKKKVMSLLVVACMALQITSTTFAKTTSPTDETVWEEVTEEMSQEVVEAEEVTELAAEYEEDDEVRVMIVMEEEAVVDAGYSTSDITENSSAMAYSDEVEKQQEEVVEQISEEVLEGEELDVRYNFTILTNAVAATVHYNEIESIKEVEGVSDVFITPKYDVMETAEINTITSGTMVGSYNTWEAGYTGAGQRIAVIDTGIDSDHPSFNGDAYDYALEERAKEESTTVEAYHLLKEEEIKEVLPNLNATSMYSGLTEKDLFLTDKIPFAFNYVDENLDVTHDNDGQGDHGTHVSGIACANRYVPAGEEYKKQESGVVGIAPEAQLITMKVFGTNGGAYTDDYMAAIEDAILLKADVINLSLGSSSAGNSTGSEAYINEIFNKLQGSDTVVSISAGNSGRWSDDSNFGANLASDVNLDTVGSPGSYTNAFTVASAVNSGYTGYSAKFDGETEAYYADGSNAGNVPFTALDTSEAGTGTEYEFVLLEKYGESGDYTDINVKDKIVLVSRGAITFAEKHMNAEKAGAKGVFVYNNTSGTISMTLSDSTATIPCASITLADKENIKNHAAYDETTKTYSGKVVVKAKVTTNYHAADGYLMSDFSSVGVPGSLEMKPEITGPGGNIYSTLDDGQYGLMSGTSMSAPSVAGMSALLAQYIKDQNLTEKTGLSIRTLSQALLMSTAIPLTEKDGEEYSPRSQGAGLANIEKAVKSPAYILVGDKNGNDGKVKVELGDDPERTGVYGFDFTIYNLSDKTQYYTADSSVLTEELIEDNFIIGTSSRLNPNVTIHSENEVLLYDLNRDNVVDKKDANVLLAHVNGKTLSFVDENQDVFDFNKDGVVNTADVYHFLNEIKGTEKTADFSKKIVAVEDTAKVHVEITLSEKEKEYLNNSFENGMYVDGYIYMRGNIDLSVPFLAFYGNWGDSSMYEPFDFLKHANNEETYPTYTGVEETNYFTYSYAGDSKKYKYTSNMYTANGDAEYLADRNAISSTSGDKIGEVYYTLIRNAARVITTVTNAETGEVYKKSEKGEASAAYYSASGASWENTLSSAEINWNGTDAKGNPLPEGTKVRIAVTAVPAYFNDLPIEELSAKGLSLEIPMVIDNTAPKKVDAKQDEDGKMALTVSDNRYVASVKVYASDKKTVLQSYDINQTELGADTTIKMEVPTDVFYVKVIDYAGNYVTYRVNNSGHEDVEEVESIVLDKEEVTVLKGGTVQLTATVGPTYALNDAVAWTSLDDTIASVDENGIVKAKECGTTVIKATTVANGKEGTPLSAECTVKVETLEEELNGIVWDENGEVYWSSFNTSDLGTFHNLSDKQGNRYMSVVQVGDKLIGATYDTSQNSDIYLIDPQNGYEATQLSQTYWCTDMGYSDESGVIYATYGPYVHLIDASTGTSIGALNLASKTNGEYLVGITYVGSGLYQGYTMDVAYIITRSGSVYEFDFLPELGAWGIGKVGETGISTNGGWYYDSFYYDAETDYFFYSVYDKSNYATLYAIKETDENFVSFELGKFPEGVWPVSGLYKNSAPSSSPASERAQERSAEYTFETLEKVENIEKINEPIQGK